MHIASSPTSEAYARLAKIYHYPPLPFRPPPIRPAPSPPRVHFDNGLIMVARRMQAQLFPAKPQKSAWGIESFKTPEPEKLIPGWTDGSNAWRASVYNFAPPRDFTLPGVDEAAKRAYGSYVASPHRSRRNPTVHATDASSPREVDAPTQQLYDQYCASLTRRFESRVFPRNGRRDGGSATSPSSPTPSRLVREISLVKPGAEGRLLVPDVKLKRTSSSMPSTDYMADKRTSALDRYGSSVRSATRTMTHPEATQ